MTTTTTADPHASQEDIVIEVLKDFPDNVAAFACHGHLTKADYEMVLIPAIEDKLKRHRKLRAYTEIAPDFAGIEPGAFWEDTKFGFAAGDGAAAQSVCGGANLGCVGCPGRRVLYGFGVFFGGVDRTQRFILVQGVRAGEE